MKNRFDRIQACCLMLLLGLLAIVAAPTLANADTGEPFESQNFWGHNYIGYRADVVSSAIEELPGGGFQRAEIDARGDGDLHVETYGPDFEFVSSKVISREQFIDTLTVTGDNLLVDGSVYLGETYNYISMGCTNALEEDSQPVIQLTQFDKQWQRQGVETIRGANTYIPFDAGSCRFAESGDTLMMRTCHEMYDEGDGNHHQACMTFKFTQTPFGYVDGYYDIANLYTTPYGYVSHSFNQYLVSVGGEFYSLDHGDAHTRSAVIKHLGMRDQWMATNPTSFREIFKFTGQAGNNYTGATVDGFTYADSGNLLVVGTSVDQENFSSSRTKNVWLAVTPTDLSDSRTVWLTSYPEGSDIGVQSATITKVGSDRFLVMWGESTGSWDTASVKYVFVDGEGAMQGSPTTIDAVLSDCDPILTSDGDVVWYATGLYGTSSKPSGPAFYQIDGRTGEFSASRRYREANIGYLTPTLSMPDGSAIPYWGLTLTYTGEPLHPLISLKVGNKELQENVDYTIAYEHDVDAGEASYTISGIGDYNGQLTGTYTISPAQISQGEVVTPGYLVKTTPQREPDVQVIVNGRTLERDVDYTLEVEELDDYWDEFLIAITGTGNYEGRIDQYVDRIIPVEIYRLYNPSSGEHLFTTDRNEYDTLGAAGWKQESVAFTLPRYSNTPVYRLYNPWTGDHHYTTDYGEYMNLAFGGGWNGEGVFFYSLDQDESAPVYRLFNPYVEVGTHHYTQSRREFDSLPAAGWRQEEVAWYAIPEQS